MPAKFATKQLKAGRTKRTKKRRIINRQISKTIYSRDGQNSKSPRATFQTSSPSTRLSHGLIKTKNEHETVQHIIQCQNECSLKEWKRINHAEIEKPSNIRAKESVFGNCRLN